MIARLLGPAVVAACLAGPATAADWTVVADQSRLGFTATQQGNTFNGAFTRFDARIRFDPAALDTAQVAVDIDTGSIATGNDQWDQFAVAADWFHVASFPQARFQTTAIRHLDADRYEADARLTIRDKTVDVTLPFTLAITGDRAAVQGQLTIDRLDFDVGANWASESLVGLNVTVTVDLVAQRAAP